MREPPTDSDSARSLSSRYSDKINLLPSKYPKQTEMGKLTVHSEPIKNCSNKLQNSISILSSRDYTDFDTSDCS